MQLHPSVRPFSGGAGALFHGAVFSVLAGASLLPWLLSKGTVAVLALLALAALLFAAAWEKAGRKSGQHRPQPGDGGTLPLQSGGEQAEYVAAGRYVDGGSMPAPKAGVRRSASSAKRGYTYVA